MGYNVAAHRAYGRVRQAIENNDLEAVRRGLAIATYDVRAEIMPYLAIEANYRSPEMAALLRGEASRVDREASALADMNRRDRNIALTFGRGIRRRKPSGSTL